MTLFPEKPGEHIKALRLKASLGIRELARLADMSPGAISAIERNQSSPTLVTLHKILKALGTNFGEFFRPQDDIKNDFIFHKSQMRSICDDVREYLFVFPKRHDIQFNMMCESISATETLTEWEVHDFDLGGLILSGAGKLEIDGQGNWPVAEGDAFYIRSGWKHRMTIAMNNVMKLITVFYPAQY